MRLIDADKLWDVMNKATLHHIVTNTLWNTLKSVIENAPTIDAVQVVRCKDCKKQFTNDCYMIYGKNMMRNLFDNDFCSYGERREP